MSQMQICSLLLHHRNDAVTRDHFDRLRHFSAGPTISVSSAEPLDGGTSIEHYAQSIWRDHVATQPQLIARSTDLLLIDWFRNRPFDADRYAIFEWDTLVNCPVADWFSGVAEYPLAGPSLRLLNREMEWFRRHSPGIPISILPLATGIVPFSCLWVSHETLLKVERLYDCSLQGLIETTGELRFATMAAICGIAPVAIPSAHMVTWKPFLPMGLAETIYHPVKEPFIEPLPWMKAEEIALLESLLTSSDHVLEFGSGRSTFWLSQRVAKVTTIEHDAAWLRAGIPFPKNVEVRYVPPAWPAEPLMPAEQGQFDEYVKAADDLEPNLVLVDGRSRVDVCKRWFERAPTLLHDAHRARYGELSKRFLAGNLAMIEPISKGAFE